MGRSTVRTFRNVSSYFLLLFRYFFLRLRRPACVQFDLSLFGSVSKKEEEAIFKSYFLSLLFCARHVPALEPFFFFFHLSSYCVCPSSFDRLIVPFSPFTIVYEVYIYLIYPHLLRGKWGIFIEYTLKFEMK